MVYDIFATLDKKYSIEPYKQVAIATTHKVNNHQNNMSSKRAKKHSIYNTSKQKSFSWGTNKDWYGNTKNTPVKRDMKPVVPIDTYERNYHKNQSKVTTYEESTKQKCWECSRYYAPEYFQDHGICVSCAILLNNRIY